MKIVKAGTADRIAATGELYFGGPIDFQWLATRPDSNQLDVCMVNFEAGARNRVHVHRYDQVLVATAGRGIVADSASEHVMEPGDVAIIPAGHPHWHGATADTGFSHLTIERQDNEITIVG